MGIFGQRRNAASLDPAGQSLAAGRDSSSKSVAQALDGAAGSFSITSPCQLEALDAGIKPLTGLHTALGIWGKAHHLHGIAQREIGNQPAVSAQLQLAEFSSKIGTVVEQPG